MFLRVAFLALLLGWQTAHTQDEAARKSGFVVQAPTAFPGQSVSVTLPFSAIPDGAWRVKTTRSSCSCSVADELPEMVHGGTSGGLSISVTMPGKAGDYSSDFGLVLTPQSSPKDASATPETIVWYAIRLHVEEWVKVGALEVIGDAAFQAKLEKERQRAFDRLTVDIPSGRTWPKVAVEGVESNGWRLSLLTASDNYSHCGSMKISISFTAWRDDTALSPKQDVFLVLDREGALHSKPRSLLLGTAQSGETVSSTAVISFADASRPNSSDGLEIEWSDHERIACSWSTSSQGALLLTIAFKGMGKPGIASGEVRIFDKTTRSMLHIPYIAAAGGR